MTEIENFSYTNFSYTKDADKALEVFFEISNAVNYSTNLDELYRAIHKALGKILNVDNFAIAIHNEEKDSITFPYYIDEKDSPPGELLNFAKIRSLTGQIIIGKKPRFFTNKEIIEFAQKKNQHVVGTTSKVWLGAPLIIKKRVIGVVAVQSYTSEDTYQKSDLDILNSASQHIALAIERKETDDALKAQRQVLEKILESTPVGITLIENRVFKQVNNEAVKLFGYDSKEDMENKSTRMIYDSEKDYIEAGKIMESNLIKKGKADFEFDFVRKDGTFFPAQIIIISAGAKKSSELTIDIIIDISERKSAREDKFKHEKLQAVLEIAGAVCHELNQPLQAILGYSELLAMDRNSDRKVIKKRLTSIIDQISRISKITKKVSNITQYKTVKYAGDVKIFDLWDSDNNTSKK
ncbi:MAG: PAS domain S-box protein [Desulfobacteraceae bacterium]|nr:PAS domain S-box protein [Desulfobacteraceae bacterium]